MVVYCCNFTVFGKKKHSCLQTWSISRYIKKGLPIWVDEHYIVVIPACFPGCIPYDGDCFEENKGVFVDVKYFQLGEVYIPRDVEDQYIKTLTQNVDEEREKLISDAKAERKITDKEVSGSGRWGRCWGVVGQDSDTGEGEGGGQGGSCKGRSWSPLLRWSIGKSQTNLCDLRIPESEITALFVFCYTHHGKSWNLAWVLVLKTYGKIGTVMESHSKVLVIVYT